MKVNEENPLGSEKISRLLHDFALPSIIAMLVGALYNIVDQFFIGLSRMGKVCVYRVMTWQNSKP